MVEFGGENKGHLHGAASYHAAGGWQESLKSAVESVQVISKCEGGMNLTVSPVVVYDGIQWASSLLIGFHL